MKPVTDYEIITYGVEWPDHFQGCGIACTEFADVATGIGGSEKEALEDALKNLVQREWDIDSNPDLLTDIEKACTDNWVQESIDEGKENPDDEDPEETPWVYVSIRVR
jgi:hypothetical protein